MADPLTKEQTEQALRQLLTLPFGDEIQEMYWGLETDEERAAYVADMSRDYLGETALATDQLNQADMLRNKTKATGQTVGPGNLYVGQSPLQALDDAFGDYQAMKMRTEGRKDLKEISAAQSKANTQTNAARFGQDPNKTILPASTPAPVLDEQEINNNFTPTPNPLSAFQASQDANVETMGNNGRVLSDVERNNILREGGSLTMSEEERRANQLRRRY